MISGWIYQSCNTCLICGLSSAVALRNLTKIKAQASDDPWTDDPGTVVGAVLGLGLGILWQKTGAFPMKNHETVDVYCKHWDLYHEYLNIHETGGQ